MKIGINCERILMPNPAGPEKYTINLIKGISKVDTKNSYILYFNAEPEPAFWKYISNSNPKFHYKVIQKKISWTQFSLVLEMLTNPIKVYFGAVHTTPILMTPFVKTVNMIHGLEYAFSPEALKAQKLSWRKWMVAKHEWFVCKFSTLIIVPSEHTKNAILNAGWGIKPQKIKVIYEGVSPDFFDIPREEMFKIMDQFGLINPYILFVSTIQPRKNITTLVEGFAQFLKTLPKMPELDLVIVGKNGWNFQETLDAPQKFGISDRVKFLGRIDDAFLPGIYFGSTAFVSASLDEGFGLHLIEAMAAGKSCIVSSIDAYKEIGQDTVTYFNPKSAQEFCSSLLDFTKNPQKYMDMGVKAKERAKAFTWEKTARDTIRFIESGK